MPDGPISPEEPLSPAVPPTEPKYVVSEEVDRVFAEFAQSKSFAKLKEELQQHFRKKLPVTDKDKKHYDSFFAGRTFEELIRFRPDFWLGTLMERRRFLTADEVKNWYKQHDISKAQFDGLLVEQTAQGEQVSAFLEFSLYPSKGKFVAKHETFLRVAGLEGVRSDAQLIVVMPSFEERAVKRIEGISPDIKVHPLQFNPSQYRELIFSYR